MATAYDGDTWGNGGKRMVEELDTDDDSDTQGAGLISTRGTRFSSDPLRFTGIDMGDDITRPRRKHAYGQAGEESSSNSEQDTELDEEGHAQFAREEQKALVDSAVRRIRRAQARGKKEVKLTRKELAALENHRKHQNKCESKQKKREQRYAVPLSQLAPTSHKENRAPRVAGAMPPTTTPPRQAVQPPVGRFAHPSSSRPGSSESPRPASNRMSDRERSISPFQYHYVRPPAPVSDWRHLSDPAMRPPSDSTRSNLPYPDARFSQYNPSFSSTSVPSTLDPFRYMTSGPSAPHHVGSAASLRDLAGSPMGFGYYEHSTRGGASVPRRESRHFTPEDNGSSSEADQEETSDETDAGVRIGDPRTIGREVITVEVDEELSPEPRVTRSKKATPSTRGSPRSSPKSAPKSKDTGGSRKKGASK